MNRTTIFVTVASMVVVSIIAAGVIAIIAPEGFLTFTGFLGSTFVAITGFAVSLHGLSRVNEKVTEVAEQTNGRLTSRDLKIARLERELIQRGHGEAVVAASTKPRSTEKGTTMSDTPIYDNAGNSDEPTTENNTTPNSDEPTTENNTTPNRWIPSKAARLWLYGVAVAAAAVLIGYGFLTVEQGGLWLSLFAALLGVGNAVAARNVPKG